MPPPLKECNGQAHFSPEKLETSRSQPPGIPKYFIPKDYLPKYFTDPALPATPHSRTPHAFKFCTREEPLKESLNPAFQVATLRGHIPFQMPSSRAGQLALGQAGSQTYSMHRADLQQGLLPLPVISDRPPVLWTLMFVYQGQVECSPLG